MICKILGNKLTFWLLKGEQFPVVWVFLDRFQTQTGRMMLNSFILKCLKKKSFCVLFLQLLVVFLYDISLGLYVLPFNVLFFKKNCIFIQVNRRVISSTCAVLQWHTVNERCYFTATSVPAVRTSAAFRILSHVHPSLWCHLAKHHS